MVSVATSEDVREAFQKNFSELVMDLNAKAIADDLLTENIIDFDLHCDLLSSGEEDANVHLVKYFCKSSTPRLMEHFENVLSRSSTKFPKHANLAYKLVKEIKMQSSKKMRDSKVSNFPCSRLSRVSSGHVQMSDQYYVQIYLTICNLCSVYMDILSISGALNRNPEASCGGSKLRSVGSLSE